MSVEGWAAESDGLGDEDEELLLLCRRATAGMVKVWGGTRHTMLGREVGRAGRRSWVNGCFVGTVLKVATWAFAEEARACVVGVNERRHEARGPKSVAMVDVCSFTCS